MSSQPPPPPWQGSAPWHAWWQEASRPSGRSDMRIGDAERAQMADLLAKHYSDGRLDEPEFRDRLDRCMSAKTRSDLYGLTNDLPQVAPEGPPPAGPPVKTKHHHPRHVLGAVLLAVLVVSALGAGTASFMTWHVPWVLVAVVVFLALRRGGYIRYHRHHDHTHSAPYT